MANVTSTVIREDGPRHTVLTFLGTLDTPPLGSTLVVDPAVQYVDPSGNPTTLYRVDTIDYVIADGLSLNFQWDATTPLTFIELYGRGNWSLGLSEGGLNNTAGAGITGKITVFSNTFTAGSYTFTVQMLLTKC